MSIVPIDAWPSTALAYLGSGRGNGGRGADFIFFISFIFFLE
jgi:hypothetical protein